MAIDFEANFFTLLELLDSGSRLEVESACTKQALPAGQIVYAQGDPANAVYIVQAGRVEAFTQSPDGKQSRSVSVMGKGDFFGDLGVLTGHPRLAGVRTCEATKLMQFEKLAFVKMLEKVPKVGAFFSRNLARRLHQTSTEAHVSIYAIDLAGKLEHFDLLVIFYTIISSGSTGDLELHNADNEVIGSFFFREGHLENARILHLTGLEAIWQGVVQPITDGTFIYRLTEEPATPYAEDQKVALDSTELLAQGVAKSEAFHAIPEDPAPDECAGQPPVRRTDLERRGEPAAGGTRLGIARQTAAAAGYTLAPPELLGPDLFGIGDSDGEHRAG